MNINPNPILLYPFGMCMQFWNEENGQVEKRIHSVTFLPCVQFLLCHDYGKFKFAHKVKRLQNGFFFQHTIHISPFNIPHMMASMLIFEKKRKEAKQKRKMKMQNGEGGVKKNSSQKWSQIGILRSNRTLLINRKDHSCFCFKSSM